MVLDGIGDNQETGLDVLGLDVVSEGTRGEAASDGVSSAVLRELKNSALGVGSASGLDGANSDVSGILDGDDDAGSKDELLPGLAEVDDVDTYKMNPRSARSKRPSGNKGNSQ